MFAIGEHVIHPGQGVCTVMGFRDDTPAPMIDLYAKSGHSETRILYPLAQQDRLHAAISPEAAEDLLARYDQLETDPFTERNSNLEETYFKKRIHLGAPETMRVAKTMLERIHDAQRRGKKPSSYYNRVLKEARRRSIEELAVVLDRSEQDIERCIDDAASRAFAAAEN